MLPLVVVKSLYHRKQENIAVHFSPTLELQTAVRMVKGAKWTQTHRCWYLPLTNTHYQQLRAPLKDKAAFNTTASKQYLVQRRALIGTNQSAVVTKTQAQTLVHQPLSQESLLALQHFWSNLKLKA